MVVISPCCLSFLDYKVGLSLRKPGDVKCYYINVLSGEKSASFDLLIQVFRNKKKGQLSVYLKMATLYL